MLPSWMRRFSAIAVAASLGIFAAAASCESIQNESFKSGGRDVHYEIFGAEQTGPLVIVLHGASGPSTGSYRGRARVLAAHGYTALLLHYFDATGSWTPDGANYAAWVKAVDDLVHLCHRDPRWARRNIGLLGMSLGASVALAAGSQLVPVNAIADWFGSLPDQYFFHRAGMPPLLILHGTDDPVIPIINAEQLLRLCALDRYTCESHFYGRQGHGFAGAVLDDADHRTMEFFDRRLAAPGAPPGNQLPR